MATARKTKDYQTVVFTYPEKGDATREAKVVRAANAETVRNKMVKDHGPAVDPETGQLMWVVGQAAPTS